jgi:nucleotide-binding universal stress UspA family protein
MRVLIPLDVRSGDSHAVHAAATRPWPDDTAFCLLHVLVSPRPPMPRLFEISKKTILERLDRAAEPLMRAGWRLRTEVREGSPGRTINLFTKEWGADFILIGAHDRSQLARLCLGGTAQSVLRHAPCSVEIVRTGRPSSTLGLIEGSGLKILVATDGSEFSAAALRSVAGRPWPNGTKLKVISVPEFILTKDASYLDAREIRELGDLGGASIEDAKQCISTAREMLSACPLDVSTEIPEYQDRPYQVILHEAENWHADLIVVGSHGRSGFDRVVMGSVSEAVALHAKCSVEIDRERRQSV